MNGKNMVLPFVAYFRVKEGKIVEWEDVGLGIRPPGGGAGGPPGRRLRRVGLLPLVNKHGRFTTAADFS